jgi:hypothetical protein
MMMTSYASIMLYVHPIVDCASLTFAVTRFTRARHFDDLPSEIRAKNMAD